MSPEIVNIIISLVVSSLTTTLVLVFALGQYKQKVDRCVTDIEKSERDCKELRDRLSRLEGSSMRDQAAIDKYIQSKSPLSLTDKGKLVLFESGGKQFVDNHLEELSKLIKKSGPKTAYDVQELSKKVIQGKQNDDEFIPLKDFAFKKGISLDIVVNVMGIYLRDEVLEKLGFSIDQIDETEPAVS